jgi:hypothetical protein
MRYRLCLQSMICMAKDMRMRTVMVGCHVEENELSICFIERISDKTGDKLQLVLHQSQIFLV